MKIVMIHPGIFIPPPSSKKGSSPSLEQTRTLKTSFSLPSCQQAFDGTPGTPSSAGGSFRPFRENSALTPLHKRPFHLRFSSSVT